MSSAGHFLRSVLAVMAVAASTVGAPVAAATIGISGSVLTAFADGGDDVILGAVTGSELSLLGVSFTVLTPGCSNASGPTTCSLDGLTEVRIDLGAGDDVLDLSAIAAVPMPAGLGPLEFLALGGVGNDVLVGGSGNVYRFWGGANDDVLIGGAGAANCLDGGSGDNVVVDQGTQAPGCGGPEPVFPPLRPVDVPEPFGLPLVLGALGLAGLVRRLRALAPRVAAAQPVSFR